MQDSIRAALTPELLKPEYRNASRPYAGHCYVASEAYYHLMGGRDVGLRPQVIRHEGSTHWYLRDGDDNVIDLTAEQFESTVPYESGRGCGFLTKAPSKRAQIVIDRVRKHHD